MGCCLSTAATSSSKTPKSKPNANFPPDIRRHLPGSDPNPPLEEESVKEVLSETPIPKPQVPILDSSDKVRSQSQPLVEEVKIEQASVILPTEEIVSEVSEASELCSFSESLSTVTEKRDGDGEVTQRVQRSPARVPRKRPSSGDVAGRRERGVRSPARGLESSPAKRTHISSRTVQGRKMTATATARRNAGQPNALRRDAGEGSGRRSRSPVTRGELGPRMPSRHRSPSTTSTSAATQTPATATGRSGEQTPSVASENGGEQEKRKDDVFPETAESLENPLVSLECFIFL
ncbi:hypothetical protein NMG60_11035546 [Bertholletia excelsa]